MCYFLRICYWIAFGKKTTRNVLMAFYYNQKERKNPSLNNVGSIIGRVGARYFARPRTLYTSTTIRVSLTHSCFRLSRWVITFWTYLLTWCKFYILWQHKETLNASDRARTRNFCARTGTVPLFYLPPSIRA